MSTVLEMPRATEFANDRRVTPPLAQMPVLHRLTVREYDLMIAHGILTENDRLELLNGLLINTMPKGRQHATLNDVVAAQFSGQLGTRACVRNQNPIVLDDFSEPEPDIVVALPPLTRYFDHHPTPAEIHLVVEISGSTLAYDRDTKGTAYARAGIPQYLIFNLQGRCVEDYREPDADGYRSRRTYTAGQNFNLVAFPDITVSVSDLLPLPVNEQEG